MTVKTPISPKVKYAALWGALLGIAAAGVTAATAAFDPSLIPALGGFGPLIASAVTIGGSSLAAILTKDELREKGQAAINAESGKTPAPVTDPPVSAPSENPVPIVATFGTPSGIVTTTSD